MSTTYTPTDFSQVIRDASVPDMDYMLLLVQEAEADIVAQIQERPFQEIWSSSRTDVILMKLEAYCYRNYIESNLKSMLTVNALQGRDGYYLEFTLKRGEVLH